MLKIACCVIELLALDPLGLVYSAYETDNNGRYYWVACDPYGCIKEEVTLAEINAR